MKYPEAFAAMFRACFGADAWERIQEQASRPPHKGIRLLAHDRAPLATAAVRAALRQPVRWESGAYELPADLQAGADPFHAAGLYYLQEPSAMAPVAALSPQQGERVLDLCAAPGGKTVQIGNRLGATGVLVANEIDPGRADVLAENIERTGTRAVVTSLAPTRLADAYPGAFDAALVDAPCSGEGMFRKEPAAVNQWSESLVAACAGMQLEILSAAAAMVRPGGRMVYSTCTFNPLENEWVCSAFLAREPDWELRPLELPGAVAGLSAAALERAAREWPALGARMDALRGAPEAPTERCARYLPDRTDAEGHFVALFRRRESSAPPAAAPPATAPDGAPHRHERRAKARRVARSDARPQVQLSDAWRHFAKDALRRTPCAADAGLLERSSRLYCAPAFPIPESGVLRPGLPLLSRHHQHVVPEHALAIALRSDDATRPLRLAYGDARVLAYLRGEEIELTGDERETLTDGWTLICVEDVSLGWGKLSGARIKNHYPRGLRRPHRFSWPH